MSGEQRRQEKSSRPFFYWHSRLHCGLFWEQLCRWRLDEKSSFNFASVVRTSSVLSHPVWKCPTIYQSSWGRAAKSSRCYCSESGSNQLSAFVCVQPSKSRKPQLQVYDLNLNFLRNRMARERLSLASQSRLSQPTATAISAVRNLHRWGKENSLITPTLTTTKRPASMVKFPLVSQVSVDWMRSFRTANMRRRVGFHSSSSACACGLCNRGHPSCVSQRLPWSVSQRHQEIRI